MNLKYKSFSAAYVKDLLNFAEELGVNKNNMMAKVGLNANDLVQNNSRINCLTVLDLFEESIDKTDDFFLGLHLGERARPGSFGALGYAIMNSPNLGEATTLAQKYAHVVSDLGTTVIGRDGKLAYSSWETNPKYSELLRPVHEAVIAGWYTFSQWIIHEKAQLTEVHFSHSRPTKLTEYERVFGCPIRFNQSSNALIYDARYLDRAVKQADPDLFDVMLAKTQLLATKFRSNSDIRALVAKELYTLLPKRRGSLKHVASTIGISERSIKRRLQAQGENFRSILENVRRDIAIRMIRIPEKSIQSIAFELGYRDQSAFSNAFFRWFGLSPTEFRVRSIG